MSITTVSSEDSKPHVDAKSSKLFFRAGSIPASVFMLASGILGAGALSVPFAFRSTGISLSLFLLAFMGSLSCLSIEMVTKAVTVTGKRTYEELCQHFFGRKRQIAFDLVMALFCFGTAVSYLITVADIMNPLLVDAIGAESCVNTWYGEVLCSRKWLSLIVTTFVLLPISLVDKINDIRVFSFIGVGCVVLLMASVVYACIRYGVSDELELDSADVWAPTSGVGPVIAAVSSYIFTYCTHPNVPQIYDEMNPKTERNMALTTRGAIALGFVVYALIGTAGYLAFGPATAGSIIKNMEVLATQKDDVFIKVSFVLMAFAVVTAFPLNIYPTKNSMLSIFTPNAAPSRKQRVYGVIIVVVAVYLALLIALFMDQVNLVLGFVGSSTGSIICFVCPALFMIDLSKKAPVEGCKVKYLPMWCYYLTLLLGCVFFVVGTYQSVLDMVDYASSE